MWVSRRVASGSRTLVGGRNCRAEGSFSWSWEGIRMRIRKGVRSERTSRSNSSGPARGRRIYCSASSPGAETEEGGTARREVSGERRALCDAARNAQFLIFCD